MTVSTVSTCVRGDGLREGGKGHPMKIKDYDRQNIESARLILAERERYGGVMAALVQWAERIVAQHNRQILIQTSSAEMAQGELGYAVASTQRPRAALEPARRQGFNFRSQHEAR